MVMSILLLVHILQKKCTAARFTYSTAGYLSPGEEDEEEKGEDENGERPETQEQQSRQEQHEHKQHSKKTCALPLTSRQPQTSCEQKHCKQTQCTITVSQGTCCFAHLYVTIGEQQTNKTIAGSKRMSAERWNYARIMQPRGTGIFINSFEQI